MVLAACFHWHVTYFLKHVLTPPHSSSCGECGRRDNYCENTQELRVSSLRIQLWAVRPGCCVIANASPVAGRHHRLLACPLSCAAPCCCSILFPLAAWSVSEFWAGPMHFSPSQLGLGKNVGEQVMGCRGRTERGEEQTPHISYPFINVFSSVSELVSWLLSAVLLGTVTPLTSSTAALAQPGNKPHHNFFTSAKFSVLLFSCWHLTG